MTGGITFAVCLAMMPVVSLQKRSHSLTNTLIAALTWVGTLSTLAYAQDPQNFIISDMDDTAKLTDVLHAPDAVIRAAFSRKVFAGVSALYREISAQNLNSTLFFVTGSPGFLRKPLVSLITENQFAMPWMLELRNLSKPTPQFKIEKISEILKGVPPEAKLILVGDDGERDPETYASLREKFPDRVTAIYIHRIQARAIPAGEIAYDTAMDIAIHEMESGRLSPEQAVRIGKAVLAEGQKDNETWVIRYNFCPTNFEAVSQHIPLPQESDVYLLSSQIKEKIKKVCIDRAEDEAREREPKG